MVCFNQHKGACPPPPPHTHANSWFVLLAKPMLSTSLPPSIISISFQALCKPKILPLKSVTLEKLEKMQKEVCKFVSVIMKGLPRFTNFVILWFHEIALFLSLVSQTLYLTSGRKGSGETAILNLFCLVSKISLSLCNDVTNEFRLGGDNGQLKSVACVAKSPWETQHLHGSICSCKIFHLRALIISASLEGIAGSSGQCLRYHCLQ